MNTQTQEIYTPAVQAALSEYNNSVNTALEAVQKLEAIAVTARLSKMFWVTEQKTAIMIRKDYLVTT